MFQGVFSALRVGLVTGLQLLSRSGRSHPVGTTEYVPQSSGAAVFADRWGATGGASGFTGSALRGRYSGGGSTARGRFQAMPKLSGVGYSFAQVSGSGMSPGHLAGRALEMFHSGAIILATGGGLSFYSRSRQFSKQWRLAVGDQVP